MLNSLDQQITAFVGALYDPADIVETRALRDGDDPRRKWHKANNVAAIIANATQLNAAGWNVYLGINPRADFFRSGDKFVPLARSCFVDFDQDHLTATDADGQIAEVLERIRNCWLPEPSIIVHSGHGAHAYWLLETPCTEILRWGRLQVGLTELLNSDAVIINAERIMRLPGLMNHKEPAALATLVKCDPGHRVDIGDLEERAFHDNAAKAVPEVKINRSVTRMAAMRSGDSVIEAWNCAHSIGAMLAELNYTVVGHQFRRPGKEGRGWSGTIRGEYSIHFSTKDPFNENKIDPAEDDYGVCDSFDIFRLHTHAGDFNAAVKDAARILGITAKQKPDFVVLDDIVDSADGDAFVTAFNAFDFGTVRTIAQRHTANPRQIERIVALCKEASASK